VVRERNRQQAAMRGLKVMNYFRSTLGLPPLEDIQRAHHKTLEEASAAHAAGAPRGADKVRGSDRSCARVCVHVGGGMGLPELRRGLRFLPVPVCERRCGAPPLPHPFPPPPTHTHIIPACIPSCVTPHVQVAPVEAGTDGADPFESTELPDAESEVRSRA
jgi:hypothetical protein